MREAEQYRNDLGTLNDYYDRDNREREARDELFREYRNWDREEGVGTSQNLGGMSG